MKKINVVILDKNDFKKEHPKLYNKINKYKMQDYFFRNFIQNFEDIDEYSLNLIPSIYNGVNDLKNTDRSLYNYCIKHKKCIIDKLINNSKNIHIQKILKYDSIYDIKDKFLYNTAIKYKRKNKIDLCYYSKNNILEILKTCTYKQFISNKTRLNQIKYDNLYKVVLEYYITLDYNKYFLLDLNLNLNLIKNICLNYNSVKTFSKEYPSIIKYLRKNKLIDEMFFHLNTLKYRHK